MEHLAALASDDRLETPTISIRAPATYGTLSIHPIRTISIIVLSGVRVSAGALKSPTSTPAMEASFPAGTHPILTLPLPRFGDSHGGCGLLVGGLVGSAHDPSVACTARTRKSRCVGPAQQTPQHVRRVGAWLQEPALAGAFRAGRYRSIGVPKRRARALPSRPPAETQR